MPRHALSNVSIAALRNEIERRMVKLDALKAQRGALDKQIAELEGLAAGAPKVDRKPGRKLDRKLDRKAKRTTGRPLAEYVKEVLAKAAKGLRARQIQAEVLAAGYSTRAANLYHPIMKVLGKPGFKRIATGVYTTQGPEAVGKKAAGKQGADAKPKPRKRGTFSQTADQMILRLLAGGNALATAEINAAWKKEGRGGTADNTLTRLVKEGKVKRESVEGQRGSKHSLV
jgi:hypothetical protein